MRPLSLLHRIGAVLCGVLVLQLTLLGPVAACTAPASTHGGAHAMRDMNGPATTRAHSDDAGDREGCGLPLTFGQCSTVACTSVVLAPALSAPTSVAATKPSARIVLEPSTLESSGPTAPELPPPRA